MMDSNNLIIGCSSQISKYMPIGFCRCSSYHDDDIHYYLMQKKWDKVFLCFAEQRTFLKKDIKKSFLSVNKTKTLNIIQQYSKQTDKFVAFSTTGLWNLHNGKYNINTPFYYKYSPYFHSKVELTKKIIDNEQVITIFPCNFNSKYRGSGFLFYKLILAITKNQKHKIIGDLNFYREMTHAKYTSQQTILAIKSQIVSAGILVNVKQYFTDVLAHFGKKYSDYFIEIPTKEESSWPPRLNSVYEIEDSTYKYNELVQQTIKDFK